MIKAQKKCWWVTSSRRGVSQEFSNVQGFAYKGDILAWWTLVIPLSDPLTLGHSRICKIDNDAAIFLLELKDIIANNHWPYGIIAHQVGCLHQVMHPS